MDELKEESENHIIIEIQLSTSWLEWESKRRRIIEIESELNKSIDSETISWLVIIIENGIWIVNGIVS